MNKHVKTILSILIWIQGGVIFIELIACILLLIFKQMILIEIPPIVKKNYNIFLRRQSIRCLLLLTRVSFCGLFLIFVGSIDLYPKKKSISDDIEISYGNEIILLQQSSDSTEKYEKKNIEEENMAKRSIIYVSLVKFSGRIITMLKTEDNLLLFLSYFYIYSSYTSYFFAIKTALILIFFPFLYKKLNINLYLKNRYLKPLVFAIFVIFFEFFSFLLARFSKRLEFYDKNELIEEIQNYFKRTNYKVLITFESSDKWDLELFKIFNFVYLHLTGNINRFIPDEQIALFKRQIRYNTNRMKIICFKILTIIVTSIFQVLVIRCEQNLFVQKFTKIGEYFVGYMCLNISLFPFFDFIQNIFLHKIEYGSDTNTENETKISDLGSAICKQALFNNEYISCTNLFNLFFNRRPSFNKRHKNLKI